MSAEAAHDEFHWSTELRSTAARLRSRAGTIALVCLCFGAAALAYLAIVPPSYAASTEIFLDPRGLQVVANDVTPRSESNEFSVSLVESQLRVAQSEGVLREVVRRLALERDAEFVPPPGILSELRSMVAPAAIEDDATRAMRALERAVDFRRASRSYVIVISARSEEPAKSALIADTVADVYIEREVNARSRAAARVETSMTSRLKELADRVRDSEDAVESFKVQNNLIGSATRLMSDQQLEELNTRLNSEHANVVEQRARVEQIDMLLASGAEPDANLEAVQSPTIANLRAQYAQVVRRQGAAEALLGPRHPELRVIREQRAGYRRLINEELRRIADATRSEYARALAGEQALTGDLETMKATTIRSNEAMVRLRELERVAESNREIYRAFLVRAKEIGAQGSLDTSNTRVIADAVPPNRPSGPRTMLVVIALLGGLVLSAAAITFFTHRPTGGPQL